jgi:hypothetical protein
MAPIGAGGIAEPTDEAFLESIELTPIATVVTDAEAADNPIVAANAAFCELTGYSKAEILGRNCRFLAGPQSEPAAREVLRKAIKEQRPALTEITNYRKDGSSFRNAVMIAPVLRGDSVAFFIGSQMDTSGTARLETRRMQAETLVSALTPRQRQVLDHMIRGYRNKQIAPLLGIDEKTVKMHRAGLLTRLKAPTSADAIRIGVEAGLQLSDRG